MRSRTISPSLLTIATLLAIFTSLVTAHTVITYPGYRGNNLIKNGTTYETNGLGEANGTFPYGMQWMYPCKSLLHPSPSLKPSLIEIDRQAAACQHQQIAPCGPSPAALLRSNPAGTSATQRHSSTSTWASPATHQTCRIQWYHRFKSKDPAGTNTRVHSVCHKSHCPSMRPTRASRLAIMRLSKSSKLASTVRRYTMYVP